MIQESKGQNQSMSQISYFSFHFISMSMSPSTYEQNMSNKERDILVKNMLNSVDVI